MKQSKEDFIKKYSLLCNQQLIDKNKESEWFDTAKLGFKEEIGNRDLLDESEQEKKKVFNGIELPSQPKIWIGFLIALLLIVAGMSYIILGKPELIFILFYVLTLSAYLFWIYCIHKLHVILRGLTGGRHPVTATRAAVFQLIPFFNIYWIFKWPIEFSKSINKIGETSMIHGFIIGLLFLLSLIISKIDASSGIISLFLLTLYLNKKLLVTRNKIKLANLKIIPTENVRT